jgi:divalent metal cation (Fe/Co/Zn/Cd) transporter
MSTQGSMRAIIAALLANIGIAVTKFIAAAFSGSASMLAEGIH